MVLASIMDTETTQATIGMTSSSVREATEAYDWDFVIHFCSFAVSGNTADHVAIFVVDMRFKDSSKWL